MTQDDATGKQTSPLWVGLWMERRHVVFDSEIQPQDDEYMLLYFVEGRSLCWRQRHTDRANVRTVRNQAESTFAVEQYRQWRRKNPERVSMLLAQSNREAQEPGPLRVKCSKCEGEGINYSRSGTFAAGAFSDGVNEREVCGACNGMGYLDNVY